MVLVWRRRQRQLRAEVIGSDDLSGRRLDRAKLMELDLRGKTFCGCSLRGADLTAADLRGVDLRQVDLTSAYLTGAQLCGADLTSAKLDGAYAIASNFAGAKLTDTSFREIIFDQATTWPNGFRPPRPEGVSNWHGAR